MPVRVRVLGRKEGRCFFQERPVHPQLGYLTTQPVQLGTLIGIQRLGRVLHLGPLDRHPAPQQGLSAPDLPRDLLDRHTVFTDVFPVIESTLF